MYYAMRASAPSLHRESTDSLIYARAYLSVSGFEAAVAVLYNQNQQTPMSTRLLHACANKRPRLPRGGRGCVR